MLYKKGQTILEYTIVLGVVVVIMFAMGPMLKRGTQSLVKVVADQIGTQQGAEQHFAGGQENSERPSVQGQGHMEATHAAVYSSTDREIRDFVGNVTYTFDDLVTTTTNTLINLGFTPGQNN